MGPGTRGTQHTWDLAKGERDADAAAIAPFSTALATGAPFETDLAAGKAALNAVETVYRLAAN